MTAFLQAVADNTTFGYATEYMIVDGRPFSFDGHSYLIDLYQDNHPYQVIEKAAQMGASVLGMAKAFFVCDKLGKNVIYFFPTDEDVREFSKGRVAPIIRDSPHLEAVVGDADAVGLRNVGRGFLYFRGMRSNIRMKCFCEDTEVLTRSGWKHFDSVTREDYIATRSPSGIFMWQRPTDVWQYDYNGEMLHFKAAGTDVLVTPNHRMLFQSCPGKQEWFETAEQRRNAKASQTHQQFVRSDVTWRGEVPKFLVKDGRDAHGDKWFITIPGNKRNNAWESAGRLPSRRINLADWVAFLGLYLAEGSTQGVMGGKRGGRVSISQVEKSKHFQRIQKLLPKIAATWSYDNGSTFRIGDMELAKVLFPLGNKYNKFVPEWVKNLPPRYLKILWEWAVVGDGSVQRSQVRYGTMSKKLADDMQEVLMKLGVLAYVKPQKQSTVPTIRGRQVKSTVPCYVVLARTTGKTTVAPRPQAVKYRGTVGCVSVPNGVILTRRNGLTMWSGNSIAADLLIFDELDEVTNNQLELADQRLNHSSLKWRYLLSTPTFDNYGIDREFRKSDQRYWNLICKNCLTPNITEKLFPDCVKRISEVKCILVCRKCDAELDAQYGLWIAEKQTERIRGYHLCSLYGIYTDLSELMYKFEEGRHREEFMRSKLGMPWVSTDQRLTPELVERCCERYECGPMGMTHTYMGVDQRGRELHVVIRGNDDRTRRPKDVLIKRVRKFEDLDVLMSEFDVDLAVVDGTPNQHSARDFCMRFPGRAYMAYYNENQRGSYKWQESKTDDEDYQVTVNRTESLDAMYEEVQRREIMLPNPDNAEIHSFVEQVCNLARINEVDDDGGVKHAVYKRLGEDHYAHASNYALIAHSRFGGPVQSIMVQSPIISTNVVSRRFEEGSRY